MPLSTASLPYVPYATRHVGASITLAHHLDHPWLTPDLPAFVNPATIRLGAVSIRPGSLYCGFPA
jgi:hypothetical protein